MATLINTQRELSATKLSELVRQLRRFLDDSGKSVRMIEQRCKKIDAEK